MNISNEQPSTLRFGLVEEYSAERHMAKVSFPDMGITSDWLPILIPNSLRNHDEVPLDEGEHVACLLAGTGTECGVILGAFYDDKNKPPVKDKDKRAVTFSDGTRITYDRKVHKLMIKCKGDIEITADGNITLKAARIDLN